MDTKENRNVIKRKPVVASRPPLSQNASTATQSTVSTTASTLVDQTSQLRLETAPTQAPPTLKQTVANEDGMTLFQSPTTMSSSTMSSVSTPTIASTITSPSTEKSIWKTALEETRHFAGGLISHPAESTKHFTIIRHSHGLVYYRGSATNVAISIFSDKPLPPDRTLWMQRKGFSGKTGMDAKAFFRSNSKWIDITPVERADASQLPPADDRAWRRDIDKFLRKAPKKLRNHVPRETCVLRIPAEALDGYFRIVLCAGEGSKKVLCPSPVFRVASTSHSPASVRGASLATLPVEIGLKVASAVGKSQAAGLAQPVTSVVQSQLGQYQPGFLVQEAGTAAYDSSKVHSKIENMNQRYDQSRDRAYDPIQDESLIDSGAEMIGPESGPEKPFPIRLEGKVVCGSGRTTELYGIPTANLSGILEDTLLRLNGVYFGWSCILPNSKLPSDISLDWHESIISVGPAPYSAPTVHVKKIATVHLIHNFGTLPNNENSLLTFFDAKLKVVIMGFLRPMLKGDPTLDNDKILFEKYRDIAITEASLSRPNWDPEMTLQRVKTEMKQRTIGERYVDARQYGQRQVDKVPLQMVGVRTPGHALRDRAVGRGGIWVPRG